MKPNYKNGKEARGNFERTMTALFRAPKAALKKEDKPKPKQEKKD